MPLVVTGDDHLLEQSLRLCAAVGVTPVVAADIAAARRSWAVAPAIVVCADLADALARSEPSRRDGVVVVGHAVEPLWAPAVALGAERVCALPMDQEAVIEILASALEGRGEACVVSIVGGCGGAGSTTLAAALALAGARRGLATLLVDADPLGGGTDLVLGHEAVAGMRWHDLDLTQGRVAAESLRQVLPTRGGVSSLSWDQRSSVELPASALRSVLTAAARAYDLVVVDVPRRFDAATTEVLARSLLTVLVVPEEIHALSAAGRLLKRLNQHAGNVTLVTRARSGGLESAIVGETLGLPLLGRLRHDRRMVAALNSGDGPGRSRSYRSACADILDLLGLNR